MYMSVWGKFESVVLRSFDFCNQKWSDFDLIQFLRWSPSLEVLCEEVDLIPLFKLRCHFPLVAEISCSRFLSCIDVVDALVVDVLKVFDYDHCFLRVWPFSSSHKHIGVFSEVREEWADLGRCRFFVVQSHLCC